MGLFLEVISTREYRIQIKREEGFFLIGWWGKTGNFWLCPHWSGLWRLPVYLEQWSSPAFPLLSICETDCLEYGLPKKRMAGHFQMFECKPLRFPLLWPFAPLKPSTENKKPTNLSNWRLFGAKIQAAKKFSHQCGNKERIKVLLRVKLKKIRACRVGLFRWSR